MKKIYLILMISAALIAGLAAGIFGLSRFFDEDVSLPLLKITGDVRNVKEIAGWNSIKDMKIEEEGLKNIRATYLKDIIEEAEPFSKYNNVIITTYDGSVIRLDYDDTKSNRLSFDPKDGWIVMDPDYPDETSIKMIEAITLVSQSKDSFYEYGMDIISPDKNILRITPGQAYGKTADYLKYKGDAPVGSSLGEAQSSVYSLEKIMKIEDLLGYEISGSIIVMGRDGNILYAEVNSGYIELEDNHFNYIDGRTEKAVVGDVAGVIIDAPSGSIMDVYRDLKYHIDRGEKVMLIILDGLGYHQYRYAVDNGYIDFMDEASSVKPAVSVFRPVTNAGLAAMFTGKSPAYSGIHDRDRRESLIPTIFAAVIKDNKKAVYVEGDIQIIKTEIEAELNIDHDGDGDRDDDILEYSIKNMDEGFDLMVVHFHSIDDTGHNCGDITMETMDEINRLDMYVEELVSIWEGNVIITADHGMHSTEDGGSHGEFRYEDMIVPYIVFSPSG